MTTGTNARSENGRRTKRRHHLWTDEGAENTKSAFCGVFFFDRNDERDDGGDGGVFFLPARGEAEFEGAPVLCLSAYDLREADCVARSEERPRRDKERPRRDQRETKERPKRDQRETKERPRPKYQLSVRDETLVVKGAKTTKTRRRAPKGINSESVDVLLRCQAERLGV